MGTEADEGPTPKGLGLTSAETWGGGLSRVAEAKGTGSERAED